MKTAAEQMAIYAAYQTTPEIQRCVKTDIVWMRHLGANALRENTYRRISPRLCGFALK